MDIKANEELFNEIYQCAARLTALSSLIQNNQEITPEQYKEWATLGIKNTEDIKLWMQKVYKHILSCNKDS